MSFTPSPMVGLATPALAPGAATPVGKYGHRQHRSVAFTSKKAGSAGSMSSEA
jgi:hypothetical protein